MKELTPAQKKNQAISLIISCLPESTAIEILYTNGLAKSTKEAKKLIDEYNGKST